MTRIKATLRQPNEIYYPESDGKPMADNTKQFNYIVKIKGNVGIIYEGKRVFVAGDLFWYPVKGDPKTVVAPDVLIAYNRPDGYRGSYKQWEEDNIPPRVVFEVLSHSNTEKEMQKKLRFYNQHGVEEFIIIDPYKNDFKIHLRQKGQLSAVNVIGSIWKSPVMKITIEKTPDAVQFYYPDGKPFLSMKEWNALVKKRTLEQQAAQVAKEQAIKEKEQERLAKEQALQELAALKAELEKIKHQR